MACQFQQTILYKRRKVSHSKLVCTLTDEYCISETSVCERRDCALTHAGGG